jgi:ectoine hydroxylase-related dioxygenase (phytanoyl-CoA dioxygenase family)
MGSADAEHALRNLLERVPVVRELAESDRVRTLAEQALDGPAFVIRGLYFDKTPAANWLVPWHQDLTIAVRDRRDAAGFGPWSRKDGVVHVQPPEPWLSRRFAVRIHLDDCGADNGPLRVIPGTHRQGRISGAEIERIRAKRDEEAALAGRGDALLMSPMLLHASSAAMSPNHRRVIHLEFATDPLPNGLTWYETQAI